MQDKTERLNNWNPWINSSVLICTLIIEKDRFKKIDVISKILRSLDFYIEDHPDDGCCDEGPGYWSKAGASLFECLEILKNITNGKLNVFNNKKIENIGKYILNAHISDNYVTNFADGKGTAKLSSALIYRYGKEISDNNLMKFASFIKNCKNSSFEVTRYSIYRTFYQLILHDEIKNHDQDYIPSQEYYYDDVEVFIKRGSKMYLAAKGGHNRENHNHNDIGNFIVYKNGLPVLIDVGSLIYTEKTFSDRRYEIWVNQSKYHNLLMVDGIMQNDGYEYKATNSTYKSNEKEAIFSLNIEQAYDNKNIKELKRTFTFDNSTENIFIEDKIDLAKKSNNVLYTFMSVNKPEEIDNTIYFNNGEDKVSLSFNTDIIIEIEEIKIEDISLIPIWGNDIYRTKVKLSKSILSSLIKLTLRNI